MTLPDRTLYFTTTTIEPFSLAIFLQLDYSLQQRNKSVCSELKITFFVKNRFIKLMLYLIHCVFIMSNTLSEQKQTTEVFYKKTVLKISEYLQEKSCVGVSF